MKIEELSEEHEQSFLTMLADFAAADAATFEEFFKIKTEWNSFTYRKFLVECRKHRQDWRPKAGKTSHTHYLMRDEAGAGFAYGRMCFPLDERSESDGGNLQVAVPPSLRRKGHGSVCLSLMLFEAVRAGLRRALVTCSAEDAAARRVIELLHVVVRRV